MKCSVVIPTYNRVELLRHTLNSLVWQSLPKEQFEVLVADDGSDDSTAEMVESFRGRLNVRYFFQERDGFQVAKARNLGISHAEGEVCVMLDCGVLAHSELLRAHLDSHDASDVPLAVCGYVYCFHVNNDFAKLMDQVIDYDDPDLTVAKLKARKLWLDVRETFYGRYGDDIGDLPAPWLNFWTCNVSARTEQLRSIGMFDEAFRSWGGEDIDLGYRLHRDGARFMVNREAAGVHCPHEKDFDSNIAQVSENYKYMAEKYGTPIIQLLLDVGDAVGNLDFFKLNDVIRERGLPRCADYLAEREAAGQTTP
ncbi:glycosyl transferase [Acrocarpospora phusangensis]|uniref:Glycosyl transferase n=1 Tax=Acrocarpospora phusangensis TaxID=1070424 RepID=A0A919Q3S8_9ACTN|nr:glycosyl transferase [Acrocarpospora phusangensis]